MGLPVSLRISHTADSTTLHPQCLKGGAAAGAEIQKTMCLELSLVLGCATLDGSRGPLQGYPSVEMVNMQHPSHVRRPMP